MTAISTQSEPGGLDHVFPIPEEARRLARLLGTWAFTGSLTAEGNEMPMNGTWRFTPAAAGWGVASVLEAQIEGMGGYVEHDLLGFDAETGMFHLYSLTNSGAVHDHVARWTSDDHLEFEYTGTQEGKPYREVGYVRFTADGNLDVWSQDTVDGVIESVMAGSLRRG